jgi:hypothetical protein
MSTRVTRAMKRWPALCVDIALRRRPPQTRRGRDRARPSPIFRPRCRVSQNRAEAVDVSVMRSITRILHSSKAAAVYIGAVARRDNPHRWHGWTRPGCCRSSICSDELSRGRTNGKRGCVDQKRHGNTESADERVACEAAEDRSRSDGIRPLALLTAQNGVPRRRLAARWVVTFVSETPMHCEGCQSCQRQRPDNSNHSQSRNWLLLHVRTSQFASRALACPPSLTPTWSDELVLACAQSRGPNSRTSG